MNARGHVRRQLLLGTVAAQLVALKVDVIAHGIAGAPPGLNARG